MRRDHFEQECGEEVILWSNVLSDPHNPFPRPDVFRSALKIRTLSCGDTLAVFVTNDHRAYTMQWKSSANLESTAPRIIDSLRTKRISEVSCGHSHIACLTADGELYTIGRNNKGQLGGGHMQNESFNDSSLLSNVVRVNLSHVKKVSCGTEHTLVLLHDGSVYAFGSNQFGQLGQNDYRPHPSPVRIPFFDNNGITVDSISAGRQHSLALTDNGRVFSWGDNSENQLGRPLRNSRCSHIPSEVQGELGKKKYYVVDIAASEISVALLNDGGLFAWGEGIGYELPQYIQSTALSEISVSPSLICGLSRDGKVWLKALRTNDGEGIDDEIAMEWASRLVQVSAGGSHVMALSACGELEAVKEEATNTNRISEEESEEEDYRSHAMVPLSQKKGRNRSQSHSTLGRRRDPSRTNDSSLSRTRQEIEQHNNEVTLRTANERAHHSIRISSPGRKAEILDSRSYSEVRQNEVLMTTDARAVISPERRRAGSRDWEREEEEETYANVRIVTRTDTLTDQATTKVTIATAGRDGRDEHSLKNAIREISPVSTGRMHTQQPLISDKDRYVDVTSPSLKRGQSSEKQRQKNYVLSPLSQKNVSQHSVVSHRNAMSPPTSPNKGMRTDERRPLSVGQRQSTDNVKRILEEREKRENPMKREGGVSGIESERIRASLTERDPRIDLPKQQAGRTREQSIESRQVAGSARNNSSQAVEDARQLLRDSKYYGEGNNFGGGSARHLRSVDRVNEVFSDAKKIIEETRNRTQQQLREAALKKSSYGTTVANGVSHQKGMTSTQIQEGASAEVERLSSKSIVDGTTGGRSVEKSLVNSHLSSSGPSRKELSPSSPLNASGAYGAVPPLPMVSSDLLVGESQGGQNPVDIKVLKNALYSSAEEREKLEVSRNELLTAKERLENELALTKSELNTAQNHLRSSAASESLLRNELATMKQELENTRSHAMQNSQQELSNATKRILTLNEKHTSEVERLHSELLDAKSSRDEVLIERERLESLQLDKERENNELRSQVRHLESSLDSKEMVIDSLRVASENENATVRTLRESLRGTTEELKNLSLRYDNSDILLQEKDNEVKLLRSQLETAKKKQSDHSVSAIEKDKTLVQLEKKISTLEQELFDVTKRSEKLKQDKATLEAEKERLSTTINESIRYREECELRGTKIEELEALLSSKGDYQSALESKYQGIIEEKEKQLRQMEHEYELKGEKMTADNLLLQKEMNQLKSINANQSSELDLANIHNSDLKNQLQSLQKESAAEKEVYQSLDTKWREANTKASTLQVSLAKVTGDLEAALEEQNALKNANQSLKDELQNVRNDLKNVRQENAETKNLLTNMKRDHTIAIEELAEAQKETNTAKDQVGRVEAENKDHKKTIEQLTQTISEMNEKQRKDSDAIAEGKVKFEEARDTLDHLLEAYHVKNKDLSNAEEMVETLKKQNETLEDRLLNLGKMVKYPLESLLNSATVEAMDKLRHVEIELSESKEREKEREKERDRRRERDEKEKENLERKTEEAVQAAIEIGKENEKLRGSLEKALVHLNRGILAARQASTANSLEENVLSVLSEFYHASSMITN